MESLSTEIALAVYGLAVMFALWYRVASDGSRRRNEPAAGQQPVAAQLSGPAQQPAPSSRSGSRQKGLGSSWGFARGFAKRDNPSVS
jgi:hypothetical protein